MTNPKKAVVVGAGPVGCLAALGLAKRGWSIEIYEGRPGERSCKISGGMNINWHIVNAIVPLLDIILDMRLPSSKARAESRSINLAISHRGLVALQVVDPAATQRFLQEAMPMRGRMIHKISGELDSQIYDRDGQVRLNLLLDS